MQNLQQLVSSIGAHVARNIVQEQIIYPRTDKFVADNGILELDFDGSLLEVIQRIESNIELKAIDAIKDSVILLKMMEEFKESVLLDQADYNLIYKGGYDVLELRNTLKVVARYTSNLTLLGLNLFGILKQQEVVAFIGLKPRLR
jgi:hypothetical protein